MDVPLAFTKEFFDILYEDVAELDKLQIGQQKELGEEIVALSSRLGKLTRPSKTMFHKSDLYAWRKLFDLYVQSNIFFSTRELDRGKRNAIAAGKQLQWFQDQVTKNKIIASFKLPSSHEALEHFISINAVILLSLKFQELNKQAVSKILKSESDTALHVLVRLFCVPSSLPTVLCFPRCQLLWYISAVNCTVTFLLSTLLSLLSLVL